MIVFVLYICTIQTMLLFESERGKSEENKTNME